MNNKEKRARFRQLAKHDRIRTGRQLAEEPEQPYLPLINDCLADVQRRKSARPGVVSQRGIQHRKTWNGRPPSFRHRLPPVASRCFPP